MNIDQKGWFYVNGDAREGPLAGAGLREAIDNDSITGTTLVWTKGMANWCEAKDSDLRELLFGSPPPIPATLVGAHSGFEQPNLPTPPPLIRTIPLPKSEARLPVKKTAYIGHWYDSKVGFWRIQRTISAGLMIISCAAYASAYPIVKSSDANGLLSFAALVTGCVLFVATRKLHVVAQFQKTGMKNLHTKASLRSLGSVLLYALLTGAICVIAQGDFGYGLGSSLGIGLLAYILTIFSTYGAVRACRNEALFTP